MAERDDDRHAPDEFDDPDAPASAEEVAASERLRDALAGAEAGASATPGGATPPAEFELAIALKAAWAPASLSREESHAVLGATPSVNEQALAALLRDALEAGRVPRSEDPPELHLAHALRTAHAPAALDEAEHRALVEAALAGMAPGRRGGEVVALRRRSVVVRVAFGALAGGLALAASVFFVLTSAPTHGSEAPLARARTTQPLFSEPFKAGESSARIDRIASARASDFRDNRFTKWGVR